MLCDEARGKLSPHTDTKHRERHDGRKREGDQEPGSEGHG
jgi:hypothetical protein